jgi:predicted Zn-dependent protease
LAVEYSHTGELARALEEFEKLLMAHPDYVAGYFMAAQTLIKANQADRARAMLLDGIRVAGEKRDAHAQAEMQALLDDLR